MQFITLYGYDDIVTAMIEGSSGSVWRISPPSRQEVIKELLGSPVDLTLRLSWIFQRYGKTSCRPTVCRQEVPLDSRS